MTTLRAYFQPHIQAAADTESRLISGLLLPFNEVGYTNAGALTCKKGAITLPDDAGDVILDVEHDYRQLIGKATALTETDNGIEATFEIARTRAGDDALEEVRAGLRKSLSVELADVEYDEHYVQITAGRVIGAGLVLYPAFESAKLAAAKHDAAHQETTDDDQAPETPTEEKETPMTDTAKAAKVPAGLPTTMTAASSKTIADLSAAFALANQSNAGDVQAALADIIPSNWYAEKIPGYIGELWNGRSFRRRAIPRFGHADLTSRKISGWRWTQRPEVGEYEGNKTAIPTNTVGTEEVTIDAHRIAGGHDIDRSMVDFENAEFWSAYWKAMTESYARLSDAVALRAVATAATKVTAGEMPDGISPALVYIVDGLLSVLNETDTVADTAFVAPDLWRSMMLTPHDSRLAYLDAAIGVDSGTLAESNFLIIPESRIDAGSVLVTTREAATIHEFGGGAPVRVQALNVANGGVDAAVFGYMAENIHDAGGLALVKESHA